MNWYLKVLNQYADFEGRARRTEYWMFALINMIFAITAMLLDNLLELTLGGLPYGILYFLYVLAVLIPGLAVLVRRLHDTNQSGYMVFISLIPIVGSIWLLVLLFKESDPNTNQYGPNPKKIENGQEITHINQAQTDINQGDTIILIVVGWMVLSRLFWVVLPMVSKEYYTSDWFTPVSTILNIIWSFVPLALAFSVKDKSKQVILFVLAGLYIIFSLGQMLYNFYKSDAIGF